MKLAVLPPLVIALVAIGLVALARHRYRGHTRWGAQSWIVLLLGGVVAAVVLRAVESLVMDFLVGGRLSGAEGVGMALVGFGIVGPLTVLTLVVLVWMVISQALHDDVDPPLAAAVTGAAFSMGRLLTYVILEKGALSSGVRASIMTVDEIALAATWGYGLSRSAFDGKLGGTPFGRYALSVMIARGAVEVALRTRGAGGMSVALIIAVVSTALAAFGISRVGRGRTSMHGSLRAMSRESLVGLAREQLSRGSVRPIWIVLGALGNVGGMVLGFSGAVAIGRSAHIDFGEIDRSGPGAEYAALLLVLGVIMSFPISAAVVGLAGGGRNAPDRPFVLEAGLSAILALIALLFALGVVAPVAVALGVACAPVAFVLAALGAWVAAGRRN